MWCWSSVNLSYQWWPIHSMVVNNRQRHWHEQENAFPYHSVLYSTELVMEDISVPSTHTTWGRVTMPLAIRKVRKNFRLDSNTLALTHTCFHSNLHMTPPFSSFHHQYIAYFTFSFNVLEVLVHNEFLSTMLPWTIYRVVFYTAVIHSFSLQFIIQLWI